MTFHLLPNPPTLICMKLIRHLVSVVSHSHWHCRSPLSQPLTVPLTLYRMREGCHINLCNHNTCRRISNHRNFCGSCCVRRRRSRRRRRGSFAWNYTTWPPFVPICTCHSFASFATNSSTVVIIISIHPKCKWQKVTHCFPPFRNPFRSQPLARV